MQTPDKQGEAVDPVQVQAKLVVRERLRQREFSRVAPAAASSPLTDEDLISATVKAEIQASIQRLQVLEFELHQLRSQVRKQKLLILTEKEGLQQLRSLRFNGD